MKTQYRKLQLLIRFGIIDLNDFYSVIVNSYEIQLQGLIDVERMLFYQQIFGSPELEKTSGLHFMIYKKNNIELTFVIQ